MYHVGYGGVGGDGDGSRQWVMLLVLRGIWRKSYVGDQGFFTSEHQHLG